MVAKLVPSNGSLTHEREGFLSSEQLNELSDRNLVLFLLKELKYVDDNGYGLEKREYGANIYYKSVTPWTWSIGRALRRLGVLVRKPKYGKISVDWYRVAEILGSWDHSDARKDGQG